ncbi:PLC-like phosphodiesterase [Xylaria grammica]|nr:PLC-like phosphodiesterase [Xylaria grammica]
MRFSIGISTQFLARFALVAVIAVANGDGGGGDGGNSLGRFALDKILRDARDVFGELDDESSAPASASTPASTLYGHGHGYGYNKYARWMAGLPDEVPLTHLNIPGTHDAATWNYTQTAQDGLADATRCDGTTPRPARVYRCQERSIVGALEAGIRFFDLRFALDPLSGRLVFWHGPALLSVTAGVEDVLFGFYDWLDRHPEEMVLLSFQYEKGTRVNATSDATVQRKLFDTLTSGAAARYVDQGRGQLGTLGEVRGKIVLFRRFDLDMLPPEFEQAMPGLHMAPGKWIDNSRAFELVYNDTAASWGGGAGTAFIEDFYHPDDYTTVKENVDAKFEAVASHLQRAATENFDSLFVTFTSGTHVEVDPPVYPDVMALGSGEELGINHRVLDLLGGMKGKRLGVVVMDFFEEPSGLIDLLLDF